MNSLHSSNEESDGVLLIVIGELGGMNIFRKEDAVDEGNDNRGEDESTDDASDPDGDERGEAKVEVDEGITNSFRRFIFSLLFFPLSRVGFVTMDST